MGEGRPRDEHEKAAEQEFIRSPLRKKTGKRQPRPDQDEDNTGDIADPALADPRLAGMEERMPKPQSEDQKKQGDQSKEPSGDREKKPTEILSKQPGDDSGKHSSKVQPPVESQAMARASLKQELPRKSLKPVEDLKRSQESADSSEERKGEESKELSQPFADQGSMQGPRYSLSPDSRKGRADIDQPKSEQFSSGDWGQERKSGFLTELPLPIEDQTSIHEPRYSHSPGSRKNQRDTAQVKSEYDLPEEPEQVR